MDGLTKDEILRLISLEKELVWGDEEKYKRFSEVQKIVEQIDFSVLDSNDSEPPTPKRRKTSRSNSDSNSDLQLEKYKKEIEETEKQIELVKTALGVMYDMENKSFKKFISKYGDEPRHVVSKVPFNKRICDHGEAIPLFIGRDDDPPPELCGAIQANSSYVAEVGDVVAAAIWQDKKENWILAEIVSYDPLKEEYVVDDIYEEPKKQHTIKHQKVIPLPKMRADPETNPEYLFEKDHMVLALYPQTTCFYPAVVFEVPAKAEDPYRLLFEDPAYESGYSIPIPVHQRYVIRFEGSVTPMKRHYRHI